MVIAIIALLIVLLAPSLSRFRTLANSTVTLSNLRQHAATFTLYTTDWQDAYPLFTDPRATSSVIRVPSRGFAVEIKHLWSFEWWNFGLAESYYGGDPLQDHFFPPGYHLRGQTEYWYNCAFLADPAYWRPESRTGPSQLRGTRSHEVLFPSKKFLLLSEYPPELVPLDDDMVLAWDHRAIIEAASADGSAASWNGAQITPGYPRGDGPWFDPLHQDAAELGQHTISGVHGRDVK